MNQFIYIIFILLMGITSLQGKEYHYGSIYLPIHNKTSFLEKESERETAGKRNSVLQAFLLYCMEKKIIVDPALEEIVILEWYPALVNEYTESQIREVEFKKDPHYHSWGYTLRYFEYSGSFNRYQFEVLLNPYLIVIDNQNYYLLKAANKDKALLRTKLLSASFKSCHSSYHYTSNSFLFERCFDPYFQKAAFIYSYKYARYTKELMQCRKQAIDYHTWYQNEFNQKFYKNYPVQEGERKPYPVYVEEEKKETTIKGKKNSAETSDLIKGYLMYRMLSNNRKSRK